jgi:prophage antirepressor-like protein
MKNINEVATRLDEDEMSLTHFVDSLGRKQEILIVDKDERSTLNVGRQADVDIIDVRSEHKQRWAFATILVKQLGKNKKAKLNLGFTKAGVHIMDARSELRRLDDKEKGVYVIDTFGGPQKTTAVNRRGYTRIAPPFEMQRITIVNDSSFIEV